MARISKQQVSYIRKSIETCRCDCVAPALALLADLTDCPMTTVQILNHSLPTSFIEWEREFRVQNFKQGECYTWLWLLGRFAQLGVEWALDVKELVLEGAELFQVPDNIQYLQGLEILDLTSNLLNTLPNTLIALKNLRILHLSDNRFHYCPDWFEELSAKMIYIYDNPLEQLPRRMKSLYVDASVWFQLADQIQKMECLENLEVFGLPYPISYAWLVQQSNLQRLTLYNCEMWKLPESVFVHTELESLTLMDLEIGPLPNHMGELRKLKELHVDSCGIASLPKSMKQCTNLHKVVLEYNRFKRVPSVLKHAKDLEVLDLSGNMIHTIPKWVGTLKRLDTLVLRTNELTVVPPVIQELRNLSVLSLAHNALTDLPEWLFQMTSLRRLHLEGNALPIDRLWSLQMALPNCQIVFLETYRA